jgi:GDP-4-dehydro-6-deoxy-D-mannose reductase
MERDKRFFEVESVVDNVLITGITGFAGSHLAEYIMKVCPEAQIYGTKRYRSNTDNITEEVRDKVIWYHDVDYMDSKAVRELVYETQPDRIFHLSANSFVPASWKNPSEVLANNIQSQVNLFDAVIEEPTGTVLDNCRIQIACSSEEYGHVLPNECPIKESNDLRPLSPYGVSKVAQDMLGYQYYKSHGLHVVRTRAFNHTGARRGHVFVCSTFAKQIAEIEIGEREPIVWVGNLEAVRDFTDVRDTVRGYWLALEHGEPGQVYNIGTGLGYTMGYILETLLSMSPMDIQTVQDPGRMRPSDVPRLVCDAGRFERHCKWRPSYKLEETLKWILEYWRNKLGVKVHMKK